MDFTETESALERTVAIGGLGAIGLPVAECLDREPLGFRLTAVAAADRAAARRKTAGFRRPPAIVDVSELAEADVVVEAAPALVFDHIVVPAIERGRTVVIASVGALLSRMHLIEKASAAGARLIVASGALAGLDAIRAAARGPVESVSIETRKPLAGLAGVAYLQRRGVDVMSITQAECVFRGDAAEAAEAFPANINVAAALALAGIGPKRTRVEIWADPGVSRNVHTVRLDSEAVRLEVRIESTPSRLNPRTSQLAALSVLECLRSLHATLRVGS